MLNHINKAGIKSDRWIRRMSMVPTFMVTEIKVDITSPGYPFITEEYATHATEAEILQAIQDTMNRSAPGQPVIGVSSYRVLTEYEKSAFKPMIEPFEPGQVRTRTVDPSFKIRGDNGDISLRSLGMQHEEKIVSYGTSSYGYDVRCSDEFKIFTNVNSAIVDPKNFDSNSFVDVKTTDEKPYVIIPPNSFALARAVEYFRIPRNVLTVCLGKSTYARCGIIVNVTPFEPEWEGYVTLEFSNTTPLPAKIYANEGCAQVLFFESDEECDVSYKDRKGKYQGQAAHPVPPTV